MCAWNPGCQDPVPVLQAGERGERGRGHLPGRCASHDTLLEVGSENVLRCRRRSADGGAGERSAPSHGVPSLA
jgi:hypothetical protein